MMQKVCAWDSLSCSMECKHNRQYQVAFSKVECAIGKYNLALHKCIQAKFTEETDFSGMCTAHSNEIRMFVNNVVKYITCIL
jgi:hypothetical protein